MSVDGDAGGKLGRFGKVSPVGVRRKKSWFKITGLPDFDDNKEPFYFGNMRLNTLKCLQVMDESLQK